MPQLKVEKNCPLCLSNNKKTVKLKLLRMNFTQGIIVCPTKNCPYPLMEDCMDIVTLDAPPELDPTVAAEASSGDSWSSILEQINKIVTPVNGDIMKQVDQSKENLVQENGVEEFSSYASDFIDSFVKECELKYSKSNQDLSEPPSYNSENKSMNSSMLEFDLDLGSLAISTPSGEAFNPLDALASLDCLNDSAIQTELDKSEESKNNSSSNTAPAVFEDLVFENNSKNINNEKSVNADKNADMSLMRNDVMSNLNELQNNSQPEPDASSNKVDSKDSGSNITSTGRTSKLSCGIVTTSGETISDGQIGETIHVSNEMQPDELNEEMLPARNCESSNQAINYEDMEFIYLPDEAQVPIENQPISIRRDEIEQNNPIVIIFGANGSSSVVQVAELDDVASAVKQGKMCDSNGLVKDHQKVCEVDNIGGVVKQGNIRNTKSPLKDGQQVCEVGSANKQSNKCDTNSLVKVHEQAIKQGNTCNTKSPLKDRQEVCEVDNICVVIKQGNICNTKSPLKDRQQICAVDNSSGAIKQGNICNTKSPLKVWQKVCEVDIIGSADKQSNKCDTNSLVKDHQQVCEVDKIGGAVKQGNISNITSPLKSCQQISEIDNIGSANKKGNIHNTKSPLKDRQEMCVVGNIGCANKQSNKCDTNGLVKVQEQAIKQGNICNTKSPLKDWQKVCANKQSNKCDTNGPVKILVRVINKNTGISTAGSVSGQGGTSLQNCEGQLSIEKGGSRLLNLNKLTEVEVNACSINPPVSGIGKSQDMSESKSVPDSMDSHPLSGRSKENASSSSVENETSCKTDNKTKDRTTKSTKNTPPKVLIESRMSTRSSARKQMNSPISNNNKDCKNAKSGNSNSQNNSTGKGSELNVYSKNSSKEKKTNVISQVSNEKQNGSKVKKALYCEPGTTDPNGANIDCKNGDKSDTTLDLPFKHISNALVTDGSSFTLEESLFSLILDDFVLPPQKAEFSTSYNRYSTSCKSALTDPKNSSPGMKDSFVMKKFQWESGVDRSRRRSARNIKTISETSSMCSDDKKESKTAELDTRNELKSVATIDSDNTDKLVVKVTGNGVVEDSSAKMKDLEKPQRTSSVDCSRRLSTRNVKTSSPISGPSSTCLDDKKENKTRESDTRNELKSLATIDYDNTDKPVVKVTGNGVTEDSSAKMKDLEKPQRTISVDCSRRLSTRSVKTSIPISGTSSTCLDAKKANKTKESDTPSELTSVATSDNADKLVAKMTEIGALKNCSVRIVIDENFVAKKPRSSTGVDHSRRQSAKNIKTSIGNSSLCLDDGKGDKTEESDSPCALPSIFTIDDDYIDKPVVKVTPIDDDCTKNVKNQHDKTYKHSDYTYNKNSYQSAKVVKNVKFRRVTRSSELVLTKINTRMTLPKRI